jgi:hypothetical protein
MVTGTVGVGGGVGGGAGVGAADGSRETTAGDAMVAVTAD